MVKKIKELYEYRQMLESLVLTDLRIRYKGSLLGFFWTFLNPLLTLSVYSILFKYIVRVQMDNYTAYLFIGITFWFLFNQAVQSSSSVIIRNAGLVKKIYFPKEILPLSVVISGFINYFFTLIVVFPVLIITGVSLGWSLLYFPIIIFLYAIFIYALTLIISSLNVYFRDIEHILGIILMAWFYLTPIVYSADMIPVEAKRFFNLNPLKTLVEGTENILFFNKAPNMEGLFYFGILAFVLLIIGSYLFAKLSRNFAEEI